MRMQKLCAGCYEYYLEEPEHYLMSEHCDQLIQAKLHLEDLNERLNAPITFKHLCGIKSAAQCIVNEMEKVRFECSGTTYEVPDVENGGDHDCIYGCRKALKDD